MSENLNKITHSNVNRNSEIYGSDLLFQSVPGVDGVHFFTKEQIDELLSQKREVYGFIYKNQKQYSWDSKFYLVIMLAFILSFSGLVIWKKPDLFGEVLSFLTGAFGGGLGGYGLAFVRKK
jgi:hypothetical protein